jgi:hypothetical protein
LLPSLDDGRARLHICDAYPVLGLAVRVGV